MWLNVKAKIRKWRGVLIAAPSIAAVAIAINWTGAFQLLELNIYDRFFRLRPSEPVDPRIVIITIDESDINHIGQWPMSDAVLAQLLQKIKSHNPRLVGLDLYRDLPVEPGHDRLVEVLRSMPNTIGIEKAVGRQVAPPPTLEDLDRVALADLVLDIDGKVRRGLISVKNPQSGQVELSIGAKLAVMYLQQEGITPETVDPERQHLRFGQALFIPLDNNAGGYVRGDMGGYQILLNYRGLLDRFHSVSMSDVLNDRVPPGLLRDRIVFVGTVAESLNDLFYTPYSSRFFGTPERERAPGVVIHANLTSQMLAGAIDGREMIYVFPDPVERLWVMGWSFVGASIGWILWRSERFQQKLLPKWSVVGFSLILSASILYASSYAAFLQGVWIPVLPASFGLLGAAIAIAGYYSRGLHRESEQRLMQFLEAIPVGVAILDRYGKPYYSNCRAREILGQPVVPNTEVDASKIAEIYHNYIAGTNSLYPTEKLPIVRALQGEFSTADDIEIHRGDRVIPIESWGTPIYDETGNVVYALVAFQDVTERRQAEAERERTTQQLYQLNQELDRSLDAELALTDAYGRFVPHEFLHFLGYESIVEVKLGDAVQKDMSILFSDIRNFTTLSESMTPDDNFKFINAFLSRMEPAIAEHYGFIDKYIGDAIMALFGTSPDSAVQAAISMLERLHEYNTTRQRPGRPPIRIGIGINTGPLMLGTVGGQSRMNGTVIGDAVNLAARVEELTKFYGVALLISHNTFARLQDANRYCIRLIDRVKVKGKSDKISVFEVFDADPDDLKQAKIATRITFEQAILLYNGGAYGDAAEAFRECLRQHAGDRVAQIYLQRCQELQGDRLPTY